MYSALDLLPYMNDSLKRILFSLMALAGYFDNFSLPRVLCNLLKYATLCTFVPKHDKCNGRL